MRWRLLKSNRDLSLRFYLFKIHFAFPKVLCFVCFLIYWEVIRQTVVCSSGLFPRFFLVSPPSLSYPWSVWFIDLLLLATPFITPGVLFLSHAMSYRPRQYAHFILLREPHWLPGPGSSALFSEGRCSRLWQITLYLVMSSSSCSPSDYFCLLAVLKNVVSCKTARGLMIWWSQARRLLGSGLRSVTTLA